MHICYGWMWVFAGLRMTKFQRSSWGDRQSFFTPSLSGTRPNTTKTLTLYILPITDIVSNNIAGQPFNSYYLEWTTNTAQAEKMTYRSDLMKCCDKKCIAERTHRWIRPHAQSSVLPSYTLTSLYPAVLLIYILRLPPSLKTALLVVQPCPLWLEENQSLHQWLECVAQINTWLSGKLIWLEKKKQPTMMIF